MIHHSLHHEHEDKAFAFHAKDGSEAVIDYNEANGNVFASITTPEGHKAIEKCKDSHVLKEFHLLKQINTNDTAGLLHKL